jgi:hypothetical protein
MDLIDKERFKWILTGIDYEKLNSWEEKFIESCEKQLEYKPELTFKQTEILERIYSDKWK